MLHIKCPGCKKSLSLEESMAGGVSACPECDQRFRVPTLPEKWSIRKATVGATAAAAPTLQASARPTPTFEAPSSPTVDDDEPPFTFEDPEDEQPFSAGAIDEDEEAASPQSFAADDEEPIEDFEPTGEDDAEIGDFDEEIGDDEDEDAPKKKKKKGGLGFGAVVAVLIVLWIVAAVLPAIGGTLGLAGMGIGGLVMTAGGIWLLVVAFKDSVVQGLLNLFIPFYCLYYIVRNKAAVRPFIVSIIGALTIGTVIGMGFAMGNKEVIGMAGGDTKPKSKGPSLPAPKK